ncbi:MAG: T9SS type A sorting domain-containing protein [Saprospiraceae bacterium]|nr:T9SS type A sorting domain-containing protein [Saprospiraceae bacterium]
MSDFYESFILYDNYGKFVKSGKYTPEIDLLDLENGMFFLQLKVENHFKFYKIIKL